MNKVHVANVFALVPTLVAIAFSPRYFFRKMALVARGASRIYPSPINFIWDFAKFSAASFLALLGLMGSTRAAALVPRPLSYKSVLLWVLGLALTAPIWLIPIAFVTYIAFAITPRILAPLHDFLTRRLFRPSLAIIVMSSSTYKLIDYRRYVAGFLYFGLYSVPILTIAFIIVFYTFIFNEAIDEAAQVNLLWLLPTGVVLQFLLLRPYVFLLTYSVKIPTLWMHMANVSRLDKLLPKPEDVRRLQFRLMPQVLKEWMSLRAQLMYEERLAHKTDPFLLVHLLNHRAAVFSTKHLKARLENAIASIEGDRPGVDHIRRDFEEIEDLTPLFPRYRSAEMASAFGLERLRASVKAKRSPKVLLPHGEGPPQITWCPNCQLKIWPTKEWNCPSCLKPIANYAVER
jgi:rubrerythrin